MSEFFIITTMVATIAAVIFLLTTAALWIFAKKEGRFHIKRGLGGGGVDLIRHQPLSNKISQVFLKWKGGMWLLGKEAMFFDLSKITDPKTPSDQLYNELISKTSTWSGNGRPVVLASDVLSFAVTPDMAAAVSKAENLEKYTKAAPIISELRAMLEENKVELVTFLQIIQPDDLRKHFEDAGPAAMRESFLLGVKANELQNVKPPGSKLLGAGSWIMWLLLLGAVVVIMYLLISSGALQNFLGGAKK